MNEIDLLRVYRPQAEGPSDAATESARVRLTAAIERETVASAHRPSARSPRQHRLVRIAAVAAAGLVSVAVIGLTPPGQAATGFFSHLISGPNHYDPGTFGDQLHNSTLIGEGDLPTGDRYQLRGFIGNGGDGGCVGIVWETSDRASAMCANERWKGDEVSEAQLVGRLPEDETTPGVHGMFVMGTTPADTTNLVIRVPSSPGVEASEETTQLFPTDGEISDATGASANIPELDVFVGYLPPGAGDIRHAPPAKAVAFNGDQEIGSADLRWLSFAPPPDGEPVVTPCVKGDPLCASPPPEEPTPTTTPSP